MEHYPAQPGPGTRRRQNHPGKSEIEKNRKALIQNSENSLLMFETPFYDKIQIEDLLARNRDLKRGRASVIIGIIAIIVALWAIIGAVTAPILAPTNYESICPNVNFSEAHSWIIIPVNATNETSWIRTPAMDFEKNVSNETRCGETSCYFTPNEGAIDYLLYNNSFDLLLFLGSALTILLLVIFRRIIWLNYKEERKNIQLLQKLNFQPYNSEIIEGEGNYSWIFLVIGIFWIPAAMGLTKIINIPNFNLPFFPNSHFICAASIPNSTFWVLLGLGEVIIIFSWLFEKFSPKKG
ncbi:MAG: hypothetical protein WB759_10165 [Methanoregula sp.]|uniref:hypothetical protein n=2 Tax=Methanoregula sp. TaxID=2052170 RepID=UPI003BAED4A0